MRRSQSIWAFAALFAAACSSVPGDLELTAQETSEALGSNAAVVDVTTITGQTAVGPFVSWQTPDGPYNVEHVGGRSPSGDLLVFYWQPDGRDWQVVNVTQKTGIKIAGPLTSWQTPNGTRNVEHLAGRAPNGDLIVFYWQPDGRDWQSVNVTRITGQAIAGSVTSWQTPNGPYNVEHLAGRAPNGDLFVFYWQPDGRDWQRVNVSALTGVKVASDAASWQTTLGPERIERLAATDAGGALRTFAWQPSHDWHSEDVTGVTGQSAAGDPVAYTLNEWSETRESIATMGPSGSLIAYATKPSVEWQSTNLTTVTGKAIASAPAAWLVPNGSDVVEHIAAEGVGHRLLVFWGAARPLAPSRDVLTQHNDKMRTGAYLAETALTPATVGGARFGKLYARTLDGMVMAQPLYVRGVDFGTRGRPRLKNVVYVATEKNRIYAFDADNLDTSPTAGVLAVTDPPIEAAEDGDVGGALGPAMCGEWYGTDDRRWIGITGTPVIDRAHGVMYVVARSAAGGVPRWFLHKISLTTLHDVQKVEVTASGFDPAFHMQRPALLLVNGVVYLGFGTKTCDVQPYHGWVIGYRASDLGFAGSFDTTPNVGLGGIWQSGNGLVANEGGEVLFETGNADVRTGTDWGDSFMKLQQWPWGLAFARAFTPSNWVELAGGDTDLGSGGPMVLPGTGRLVGGGKQGTWYPLYQSSLAAAQPSFLAAINTWHDDASKPACPHQWEMPVIPSNDPTPGDANQHCYIAHDRYGENEHTGPNIHGGPILWNRAGRDYGFIYQMAEKDYLKAFRYSLSTGLIETSPVAASALRTSDGMAAAALSLSANDDHAGIVWAVMPKEHAQWALQYGRIVAFDARTLHELWRDDTNVRQGKFATPTIADGKVFRTTFDKQLIVYGLR